MERSKSIMILAFIGMVTVVTIFSVVLTLIILNLIAENAENVSDISTESQEQPAYVPTPPNTTVGSDPAYSEDWPSLEQEYEENLRAQMELEEQQRMRQALDNLNFQLQQLRERLRWSQIQDIFVDPEDVGVSN